MQREVDYPGPDGFIPTVAVPDGPVKIILWAHPFGVRIEAVDPDGNRISLRERRKGSDDDR